MRLSWAWNLENLAARRLDVRFKSNFCLWHRRIGANDSVNLPSRILHACSVLSIPGGAKGPALDRCHRGDVQRRAGGTGHLGGQRQPAPYRGVSFVERGRGDMGADVLYRGQRHHPSGHWMAGQLHGAQAAVDDCGDWVHGVQYFVRPGAEPAHADLLSGTAGNHRRRAAATVAGGPAGRVSGPGARQGDGLLGNGNCGGAHPWPYPRRLDHRFVLLALGLLHQCAGRHSQLVPDLSFHSRSALYPAWIAARRSLGTGYAGARHGRFTDHAGQGAGERLV